MEAQEKINIEMQKNNLNIRHGDLPKLPDIFQYKGFQHRTTSAEGFVELVKTKSNKPNCVVFWDDDGDMTAIMDDTVYDRPQDKTLSSFRSRFSSFCSILRSAR